MTTKRAPHSKRKRAALFGSFPERSTRAALGGRYPGLEPQLFTGAKPGIGRTLIASHDASSDRVGRISIAESPDGRPHRCDVVIEMALCAPQRERDRVARKRLGELTVNVQVVPDLKRHENGGEYIALGIPRAAGVASTSNGRYFLRVGDTCRPIVGDD